MSRTYVYTTTKKQKKPFNLEAENLAKALKALAKKYKGRKLTQAYESLQPDGRKKNSMRNWV
jgi:hypothetical protein